MNLKKIMTSVEVIIRGKQLFTTEALMKEKEHVVNDNDSVRRHSAVVTDVCVLQGANLLLVVGWRDNIVLIRFCSKRSPNLI